MRVGQKTLDNLLEKGQIALVYGGREADKGIPANGEYPFNPNGSLADIAGICNSQGNVLGLMPHPENNVVIRERDSEEEKARTKLCLDMWKAGVNYVL